VTSNTPHQAVARAALECRGLSTEQWQPSPRTGSVSYSSGWRMSNFLIMLLERSCEMAQSRDRLHHAGAVDGRYE
jgi:hypothetical protein